VNESAQTGKLRLLLYSRSFEIDDGRPRSTQVQADGHFDFHNVAPGDYTILLEAPRFGIRQQSELAVQILQKQDLSIAGSDVRDLTLSSLPLGTITGRITLEHATAEELAAMPVPRLRLLKRIKFRNQISKSILYTSNVRRST
jgi:hypothetical protein